MSGKYGFGGTGSKSGAGGLKLPQTEQKPVENKPKPDPVAIQQAVKAGQDLGFVSREPETRLKPGPKRKEPQDKVSIPGPARVIARFRTFASGHDMTLWQALEHLLDAQEGRGDG